LEAIRSLIESIASAPKLAKFSFCLGHGGLLSVDPFTCVPKPEGVLPNYIQSQCGTGRGAQVRNQAGFMALQLRWPVFFAGWNVAKRRQFVTCFLISTSLVV